MKGFRRSSFELIFWLAGLTLLALTDPAEKHFTLCPLANLGITWCPGCGIGHSISFLFRGEFAESFSAHWFGLPALLLIAHRIYILAVRSFSNHEFNLMRRNYHV